MDRILGHAKSLSQLSAGGAGHDFRLDQSDLGRGKDMIVVRRASGAATMVDHVSTVFLAGCPAQMMRTDAPPVALAAGVCGDMLIGRWRPMRLLADDAAGVRGNRVHADYWAAQLVLVEGPDQAIIAAIRYSHLIDPARRHPVCDFGSTLHDRHALASSVQVRWQARQELRRPSRRGRSRQVGSRRRRSSRRRPSRHGRRARGPLVRTLRA